MANEFVARNGLIALDNSQVSGSLKVTNGITGSLFGTASWAQNAVSSSYVLNAISASFSTSASQAQNSNTASYVLNAVSASFATSASQSQNSNTASYVLNAVSSSFALTASSADNFTVRGTLTAQTIVAQVITSSTDFVTGSTRFGSLMSNTHVFTGSVGVTGSFSLIGGNAIVQSDGNADGVSALTIRNNIGTQVLSLGAAGGIIMSNSARITNNSTALAPYIEVYNNSDGNLKIQSSTSYNLILQPDSRNVGIGTLTPNAKLDVNGNAIITGSLTVTQGITGSIFGSSSFSSTSSLPIRGIITASAAGSIVTFTKGDNSQFSVTLTTATAETASFVLSSNVDGPLGKNSVLSASFAVSASRAITSLSSSYSVSSSLANAALTSTSASFASTSSLSTRSIITASAAGSTITFTKGDNSQFSVAISSTSAETASYVLSSNVEGPLGKNSVLSSSNALTASYVLNAVSSSFSTTSSRALSVETSSFSLTASSADNFTVRGTLTAETIVAQVITSSTDFVTGSTRFGTLLSNTHQFTGSVSMTGSLNARGSILLGGGTSGVTRSDLYIDNTSTLSGVYIGRLSGNDDDNTTFYIQNRFGATVFYTNSGNQRVGILTTSPNAPFDVNGNAIITGSLTVTQGITSSLFGTASWSNNSVSASFSTSASRAITALSSSLSSTASFVTSSAVFGPFGANSVLSASFAVSAAWAPSAGTTVFPFTGSALFTGSMSLTGSYSITGSVTASSFVITDRTGSTQYTYGYLSTAASSINVISSVPTGSFRAAFYNYVATSGSNARAGQISSVWFSTTCSFAEYITTDIGTTAQVDMYVRISGSFVQLMASSSANWIIDTSVNLV